MDQIDYNFNNQFDKEGIYTVPDIHRIHYCAPDISSTGFSILHKWVLLTKKYPCVEDIIEKYLKFCCGRPVNETNVQGWTPLMLAVRNCNTLSSERTVFILLHYGANIELQNSEGDNALILASKYSRNDSSENIIQTLINIGANINSQNYKMLNALMYAITCVNSTSMLSTVKLLIDYGTNLDLSDKNGHTVLTYVAQNARIDNTENILKMLIDAEVNLDICGYQGLNALMIAVFNSRRYSTENAVKMLIDAGTNLDLQSSNGNTALMLAVKYINDSSTENTVKMLIDAGANLEILNTDNFNILHQIARYTNNISIIKMITNRLENISNKDAFINAKSRGGNTPLFLAAMYDKTGNIVNELINMGVDLNIQSCNKYTALMSACKNGNLKNVKHLVYSGCDLNICDNCGFSPLKRSVYTLRNTGNLEKIVRVLVDAGADLDKQCNEGYTALMTACSTNKYKIAVILIKDGCNMEVITNNTTALSIAQSYNLIDMMLLLIKHGCKYTPNIKTWADISIIYKMNYDETINKLGIQSNDDKTDNDCMVCFEKHDKILQLPCGHVCCFEEIVNYNIQMRTSYSSITRKMLCFYKCSTKYKFADCKMISCS